MEMDLDPDGVDVKLESVLEVARSGEFDKPAPKSESLDNGLGTRDLVAC